MWGGDGASGGGGGGVSSSQLAGMLIGYATETWVDEHYISIDFFSRLFQAHGTENGSEIDVLPNDMDTTITSVESMFGFWTNLYISALGSNGAAPAGISLGMLTDVSISGTPSAGQVLTFDAVTQKWVNANAQAGVTSLGDLNDVRFITVSNEQFLMYYAAEGKWVNMNIKNINGQSLVGSGNISVGGGASGNYLPLSGGEMVGSIYFNNGGTAAQNGTYARLLASSDHIGGIVLQLGLGNGASDNYPRFEIINRNWNRSLMSVDGDGVVRMGGNDIITPGVTSTLRVVGSMFPISAGRSDLGVMVGVDSDNNPTIGIYGNSTIIRLGGQIKVDLGLEIYNLANNTPYIDFHYNNSTADFTSRIIEYSSGKLTLECAVGIGSSTIPSYTLHVAGTIYATGAITALSDARKKDIMGGAGVTVEQIAHAPAVQFLWKDKERRKDGQQVGTLAQYWQTVLPEVVMDKGGELSMQYGVAALVSAIVTARKVVDHERRIHELEKENERLKKEVEQLRLN